MRFDFTRAALVAGAMIAVAGFGATTVAGCSDDDSTVPPGDAGGDTTLDSPRDAPPDVPVPPDAQPDVRVPDSPADFAREVTKVYCAHLRECCLVSCAQWNQTRCEDGQLSAGGFAQLAIFGAALDGGNVDFDRDKAKRCLAEMASYSCGLLPTSEQLKLVQDCFGSFQGKIPLDGPCSSSTECVSNAYCAPAPDGGAPDAGDAGDAGPTGRCRVLKGQGSFCSNPTMEECSYLGTGVPGLFCEKNDAGTSNCVPLRANDQACNDNKQCASGLCNYPKCGSSIVVSDPGISNGSCTTLTTDAGDGGACK